MKNKYSIKKIKRLLRSKKPMTQILAFLIKFNLLAIPLYIILMSGFQWTALNQATESAVFNMLIASGVPASISDQFITIPIENGNFAGDVNWDCTGWKSMYALFALIFATAFSLRKKIYGLLFIPVVYLINLVRIWFMFWFVYTYGAAYYSVIHATIWSWGLIAAILALWLVWMRLPIDRKIRRKRK